MISTRKMAELIIPVEVIQLGLQEETGGKVQLLQC